MNKEDYLSKIEFVIAYILFGIILLFQYSRTFTYEEIFLFFELILAYIWTMGLYIYAKVTFDLNIFEPVTMITLIYEGIFVVKPIIDLRAHTMYEHGLSVISGGPKATALFMIGYSVFWCSYYMKHRTLNINRKPIIYLNNRENIVNLPALYGLWLVVYSLCIYCMLTQGLSLKYIFSFGSEGVRLIDESNTALLFLSNFGITLITLWLMILIYSKNGVMKVCTTMLCIVYILMRNARWLMLVFIISPVTFYFLKRKKQPRLIWVVLISAAGLTVFAWMQANRSILAAGGAMQGWGYKGFTLETLLAPLESDLSTYRTFYSMVERYPSQYSYLMGKTFLYSLILFIPRAIWPGKPDNPVRDMIENSLNKKARVSGTAVANIGEFYANFGLLGIVVFMYLLGWIAASLKKNMFHNDDEELTQNETDRQIAYSILFPLLFQWIARGNFSGNLYLTVFALLPFIVKRVIKNVKQKRNT